MKKNATKKDIVSALVRLNNEGLSVPVTIEELKKLPIIPNTGGIRMKKKCHSDFMNHQPGQNNY